MKRVTLAAILAVAISSCSAGGSISSGAAPPVPAPPGGSGSSLVTSLPAHYAIVDLGPQNETTTIVLNDRNHAAGTTPAGNVFFYDGTLHTLAAGTAMDMNDGDIIVGYDAAGGAIYKPDGTVSHLASPAPGYTANSAMAINDAGQIAGAANNGCHNSLAVYDTSGTGKIVEPDADAVAINSAGTIAYQAFTSGGGCLLGTYWPTIYPGPVSIPMPANLERDDVDQQPTDINDAGHVVGYYAIGNDQGLNGGQATFLYENGSTTEIDPPGGVSFSTHAQFVGSAINNEDWIAGFVQTDTARRHAYVWINGTFTDLNSRTPVGCNWVLQWATDVNDQGYITGLGAEGGSEHGFLLIPQP